MFAPRAMPVSGGCHHNLGTHWPQLHPALDQLQVLSSGEAEEEEKGSNHINSLEFSGFSGVEFWGNVVQKIINFLLKVLEMFP